MAGIYIHIPFCKKLCGYCDFFKSISLAKMDEVHKAIVSELESQRHFIPDREISTIYFGGGTPSIYSPEDIQAIIDKIKSLWDCSRSAEITLEANPDDLTERYFDALLRTDINRLSIGVQSFDDDELRHMGRRHNASQAIEAVKTAQDKGLENLSIDLMYGLPFSDTLHWKRTLRQAVDLGVPHISAYHLTIEPGTVFGKKAQRQELSPVAESLSEEQYLLLHATLTENGFEHYEISNFARPGFRSRHNSSYWSAEHYLGAGPGAHSFNGTVRRWAVDNIGKYLSGQNIYTSETLSENQMYDEYVMTALRRMEGASTEEIGRRFGAYKLQYFTRTAKRLAHDGLLTVSGDTYRIPPEKFLLSDMIICDLFY